jgi:hypothetical protein
MLDGAAWCAPGVPLPHDLVLVFVPDGTDNHDAVDALRRLQQLGLLYGMETVVLHRLLAQVVHLRLGSQETLAIVENRISAVAAQANGTGIPKTIIPLMNVQSGLRCNWGMQSGYVGPMAKHSLYMKKS